jgi:hypothetical protein
VLTCTICSDQLCDPVSTPGGITHCRACIMQWLNGGRATCPQTRQPLQASQLAPNYVVRQLLEQLQQQTSAAAAAGIAQQPAAAQTGMPAAAAAVTAVGSASQQAGSPVSTPPARMGTAHASSAGAPGQQVGLQQPAAPEPAEALVDWTETMPLLLAAAEDSRGGAAAWQRLGRCLAECEVLNLERGLDYRQAGTADHVRCVTAFAQHETPYMVNLKSHLRLNDLGMMTWQPWHSMQRATGPSCTPSSSMATG